MAGAGAGCAPAPGRQPHRSRRRIVGAPQSARGPPRRAARSEPAPRPSVAPAVPPRRRSPRPPPQTDHNLAEMAQRLEAALRRAPSPESRPPVTDPLAAPAANAPPSAPMRDSSRARAQFEPSANRRSRPRSNPRSSQSRAQARAGGDAGKKRSTTISNRRWRACWAVRQERRDRHFRPPRPSRDGGGRSSGLIAAAHAACCRAGHQHQFRPRQRPDRARDPVDRAAHGAVAGAVDPGDDDVVHPHRGGAVAAAHRARHRDRAAQRGDRLARAVPHRLRDGAGVPARLRRRRQAADRQRDHRRAGVRARVRAVRAPSC